MKLHDLSIMTEPTVVEMHPLWPLDWDEHPDVTKWTTWGGYPSEVEVVEFLYGLVRLVKPKLIVETGPYLGHSTCPSVFLNYSINLRFCTRAPVDQHICFRRELSYHPD